MCLVPHSSRARIISENHATIGHPGLTTSVHRLGRASDEYGLSNGAYERAARIRATVSASFGSCPRLFERSSRAIGCRQGICPISGSFFGVFAVSFWRVNILDEWVVVKTVFEQRNRICGIDRFAQFLTAIEVYRVIELIRLMKFLVVPVVE